MNSDFLNKLSEISKKVPELIKRLPGIAKVEGLNFIHDNFDKEGFEDKPGSIKKWEKRKKETGKGKKKRPGRQILIDSGKLRRSWDSETKTTETTTEFTSSLPYAEPHNDGGRSGRPPGFEMPERKMIGDSEALTKRIETKFDRMVEQIFN